jgi:hypothetical protein
MKNAFVIAPVVFDDMEEKFPVLWKVTISGINIIKIS